MNQYARSIEIIKMFEPPEGYYLAFSGGKDSVCLYELAKQAKVKFDAHYGVTGIDPPEIIHFMRKHYPDVSFDRPPTMTWWEGLRKKGLPTRTKRWCCSLLKECHGDGRRLLLGVRAAESNTRRNRPLIHPCPVKQKEALNPMLTWSDEDVWAFIDENDLPVCELYSQGWSRIGCIVCPFESPTNTQRSLLRWPKVFAATYKNAKVSWENSKVQKQFDTFDEFWEWWLSRNQPWPKQIEAGFFAPD